MANNVVNQSTTTNFITVTFRDKNPSSTEVNLTSPDQIEVRSLIGPTGAAGITQDTGSLLLTASYSNPNLTFTKGDGTTFSAVISTDTPTLAQVTAQGSSTTTAITASIISASGALTASNLSGNNTGDQDLSLFVQNSQTSSFVQNSQTSSFVQNSQTSSFVQNSQTGSFAVTGSNVIFENITGSNISASGAITAGSLNIKGNTVLGDNNGGDIIAISGSVEITGSNGLKILSDLPGGDPSEPVGIFAVSPGNLEFRGDGATDMINMNNIHINGGLVSAADSNKGVFLTQDGGSHTSINIKPQTSTIIESSLLVSGSTTSHITASGNISASGDVKAYNFIGQYGTDVLQGSSGVTDSIQFNNRAHWRKSNAYISSRGNEWVLSGNGIGEPNDYTEAYVHITKNSGGLKALSLDYSSNGNKATFDVDTNGFLEIHPEGLSTHFSGSITASGNISASGNLLGGGLNINGPSNSHVEVGTYNVVFFSTLRNSKFC